MAAGASGVSSAAVVLYWGYRQVTLDGGREVTGDTSVRRGLIGRYIGHIAHSGRYGGYTRRFYGRISVFIAQIGKHNEH